MKTDARIDRDPVVRAIASAMGIRGDVGLRRSIAAATEDELASWLDKVGAELDSLDMVHRYVLNKTGVVVEHVDNEQDLARINGTYRRELPAIGVQLELEFGRDTEAVVFQHAYAGGNSNKRYVAVVDRRGARGARAWFSARHEPAHVLIPDPSASHAWRRTTAERPEPLEQVVDAVASRVGFWPEVVVPVLRREWATAATAIEALEQTRALLCPDASKESCYRAFVGLLDEPVVALWTDWATRKEDRGPSGNPASSIARRAVTVIHNDAAERANMRVWQNFRIPSDSVIARAHDEGRHRVLTDVDDLGRWRSESGRPLRAHPIRIASRGAWSVLRSAA